jgi:hypothetical protein
MGRFIESVNQAGLGWFYNEIIRDECERALFAVGFPGSILIIYFWRGRCHMRSLFFGILVRIPFVVLILFFLAVVGQLSR